MKKIDLGQTLQILGNIAILVGILLLVYELSLNRQMMRAQTRHQIAQSIIDIQTADAANAQLMDVLVRAENGEELTMSEVWQYQARTNALFRYWENVHYQFRQGLYDQAEFSSQKVTWERVLTNYSHMRRYWCAFRSDYSADFAAELDSLVKNDAC